MKFKALFMTIFFVAAILGGCEKSNQEFQEDNTIAIQKKNPVTRPFKLSGVNVGTFVPPGQGGACEVGGTLYMEGEGNATHMGHISMSGYHCFQAGCLWGPLDMTAANGDMLFTRCGEDEDGNMFLICKNPDGEGLVGPGVIDGGTGRFEGATGIIYWKVVVESGVATCEAEGTITY
jgi:hypothetical protein